MKAKATRLKANLAKINPPPKYPGCYGFEAQQVEKALSGEMSPEEAALRIHAAEQNASINAVLVPAMNALIERFPEDWQMTVVLLMRWNAQEIEKQYAREQEELHRAAKVRALADLLSGEREGDVPEILREVQRTVLPDNYQRRQAYMENAEKSSTEKVTP